MPWTHFYVQKQCNVSICHIQSSKNQVIVPAGGSPNPSLNLYSVLPSSLVTVKLLIFPAILRSNFLMVKVKSRAGVLIIIGKKFCHQGDILSLVFFIKFYNLKQDTGTVKVHRKTFKGVFPANRR